MEFRGEAGSPGRASKQWDEERASGGAGDEISLSDDAFDIPPKNASIHRLRRWRSRDQMGRSEGDAKLGKRRLPRMALFDHSVNNFFAAMDSISALCGEPSHEAFPPTQIEQFSSMILFLKEWRQFYYEPKVLNFSYETESVRVNDFNEGITLPQFSSASVSVPEMEPLPEKLRSSGRSDFVLHVGGSVWALDWCPRTYEKSDGQVNCEYLAVAAHPPGASYHKIGVPLVGRGLIQIWSLISMDKKVLSQAKPRGKGRPIIKPKPTETEPSDDLNQNDVSSVRGRRGRPRKRHAEDDVLYDSDNKEIFHLPKPRGRPRKIEKLRANDLTEGEILPVRPRGRPRKHMKQGLNSTDNVNGLILVKSNGSSERTLESMDSKREAPPSTDHAILSIMECDVNAGEVAAEVPITGDIKEETAAPKRRGRPRKKTLLSVDKSFPASAVALDDYPINNDETLSTNAHITTVDVDLGEVALSSHLSVNLSVNAEPNASKCRGIPRKKPWSSVNKCLSESVGELQVDTSGNGVLTSTHDCQSEVLVSDSCEGVTNGREETMSCSRIPGNIALPMMVFCLAHNGKVAWDVKWRPKTSRKSEGKQHIGYLAVLLGNGSLEVWEVPHPSLVRSLYISSRIEGTDPRFLKLEPVFKCSKIKCGDRQCIPLILEWSRLASSDLMLAGCHDGTVALWKFSSQCPSQDAKPLLCFTADTGPIRTLAWAPEESDPESSNLVVTTGQEGVKFWDLRDPHRPLWEPYPVQRAILSLEWVTDPRCIIISLDDGTLRTFSLWNLANDGSFIGKPSDGMKQHPVWHIYYCSSFALWSIQVSRSTGLAAYCGAEGSTYYFQLTVNSLKDSRNRVPHLLCGSLIKDDQALKVSTPVLNSPSLVTKHMSKCAVTSQSIPASTAGANQAGPRDSKPSLPGKRISFLPEMKKPKSKPKNDVQDMSKHLLQNSEHGYGEEESGFVALPPKLLAMHRVRWNMNKGSERWLCYGGAAGIVRCQEIA